MSDAPQYDVRNLEALRRDLQELRADAREEGILGPRAGKRAAAGPMTRRPAPPRADAGDKGKQVASRILAMLRRGENDASAIVRGTDFTEDGVRRLLNHLTSSRRRSGAAATILQRIHRFLTTPVPNGVQKIAGVGAEKVRHLSRLLDQIEQHGWEEVRTHLAERRKRFAAPAASIPQRAGPADAVAADVVPARRKRPNRQAVS